MTELVSYAIDRMMGRYRLDIPGLIYAHSGNERFWEIYEGEDSEQWTGDSEQLSGSDCLAEGHAAAGGEGVSNDESVSSGREIRFGKPDSASGSVDSLEHRRGANASVNSGIQELSVNLDGFPSGSGNADSDCDTAGLRNATSNQGDYGAARRDLQNATQSSPQADVPQLSTGHCSLSTRFLPDDDGIVPLTDTEWFDDDACNCVVEFISKAWPAEHLETNLAFLADNLTPKKSESSRDTIRRYLCDKFFKDHLQTYKKRPIYWLFSSGKQKAFQCLVYLHRYHEVTLARMRSEYVIPLQGKMARLEKLQGDIQSATSTAQSKRLTKEREKVEKQQVELLAFDEKLGHYADMRISIDLDDGVKVNNYGKFGNLLAEVKAVHGKKPEVA